MADTKISALTSATTPLAGTELIPLVQSSTTKNVTVANLTAGRSVSASQLGVGTPTPNNILEIVGGSSTNTTTLVQIRSDGAGTNTGATLQFLNSTSATSTFGAAQITALRKDTSTSGDTNLLFATSNGGTIATKATLSYAGDFTFHTGNLVIGTSGKGIDFSAAGGDILTTYDEGTITSVTLTPATSGTITVNASYNVLAYTQVGKMITVTGNIIVSSVSSPVGVTVTLGGTTFPTSRSGTTGRTGASIVFYDASANTWTNVPVVMNNSATSISIRKDASTIEANDELWITYSYLTA